MKIGSVARLQFEQLQIKGDYRRDLTVPLLPAVMKYSFSLSSHPGEFIPLGNITTDSTP